jgi:hypothetical protein
LIYVRKRRPEKLRSKWADNIKTDLREIGWGVWTVLIWLRIGTSEHDNEPSGSIKYWEVLE